MAKVKLACLVMTIVLAGTGSSIAQVHGQVGAGAGLPYGSPLPGFGLELEAGRYASLLGGVGFVGVTKPWAYGVRIYMRSPHRTWRPYVSALRWTEGTGFYLGAMHDVGEVGGFHITYGAGFGDVNLEGRVAIMAGIGYRF